MAAVEHPYRGTGERPAEVARALVALGALRARTRGRVLAVSLVVGFALGIVASAELLQAVWFFGRSSFLLALCFGLLPVVTLACTLGLRLGRLLARSRTTAWVTQLSAVHGVDRAALAEDAAFLDGVEAEAELDVV